MSPHRWSLPVHKGSLGPGGDPHSPTGSGILPLSRWDHYLWCHPDNEFAEFLHRGIDQGFKIRFNHFHELRPLKRNYESSVVNLGQAQQYIDEEVSAGCLRPLPPATLSKENLSSISLHESIDTLSGCGR